MRASIGRCGGACVASRMSSESACASVSTCETSVSTCAGMSAHASMSRRSRQSTCTSMASGVTERFLCAIAADSRGGIVSMI